MSNEKESALPLQSTLTYGPIRSRRLGLSLGINVLPTDYKLCSFDCIYCHYGPTEVKCLCPPSPRDLPWSRDVARAAAAALHKYPNVDYLTFSGNGEPTLHPAFPQIVAAVRDVRDAIAPHVRLALFSNATTLHRERIRQALALFDLPMMKLDAGDPATLAAINRPAPDVDWDHLIHGLQQVPNLVIQSVLIDGRVSNTRGEAFAAWVATLETLQPDQIQIYSTDYPAPKQGIERVVPYRLQRIAEQVNRRTGLRIEALWV